MIGLADVQAAAERIRGRVLRTPALPSDAVSRATGAEVTLKLENLQAIGSFKERGAANRLALLTATERAAGRDRDVRRQTMRRLWRGTPGCSAPMPPSSCRCSPPRRR